MRPAIAAGLGLAFLAAPVLACPEPSDGLLFHSCWGEASADLVLLPEDEPLPEPPEDGVRLIVTGAYTGRDMREAGGPAPVGLYMRAGEVVNRNMSRMDGLLVVDPEEGDLALFDRAAVPRGSRTLNLRQVEPRHTFIDIASGAGLDVLQSHLLIIDGEFDVRDQPDAPRFRRRILYTDADGFGLFQTEDAVSLYDAARLLEEVVDPVMALNLDMGSYDF
ncbi:MAG TPA: hypothetical protein VMM55_05410, partial [Thermohalobaculum sp.]|nr:hypothetical protein [Thermohalobaculum sp.]